MTERLVVIGGDAAGMSAASQARRRRPADDLEIVAFERGNYTSYSACGIPYLIGGVVDEVDKLIMRRAEVHRERFDIDVRLGHEVVDLDVKKRALTARDPEGKETTEGFDLLVIATGASPIRPDLPGADARHIFGVQTLDHGLAIKRAVDEMKPKNAVVVGGGYVGLEMAEAFHNLGLRTTLVERDEQPMPSLDPDMGAHVADAMRELGVEVLTGEAVAGFDTDDGRVSGVVTGSRTLPADIVVLGLGVRPFSDLADAAGVALGRTGAIAVDRLMRARVDGVWAAGDCAEKFHLISRRPVAIPLGTHANKEGRVAGINIGGGYATFPGVVGTAVSRVCDVEVARTGLKGSEAGEAGFDVLSATIESTTRARYFPGATLMKTKLIVEEGSGRLLGGQIVGREGAAKRIDAIATALWNGMTVDEMINLDLAYAPPFGPVWDPVLVAARKAWQKVEERLEETR